jgi:hypothetical protein
MSSVRLRSSVMIPATLTECRVSALAMVITSPVP